MFLIPNCLICANAKFLGRKIIRVFHWIKYKYKFKYFKSLFHMVQRAYVSRQDEQGYITTDEWQNISYKVCTWISRASRAVRERTQTLWASTLTYFKQVLHVQTKKYLVPRLPASLNHHWRGGGGGRGPENTSGQQMICPVSRYQAVFPVVVCECGPAPGKTVMSTRAQFEVAARVLPSFLPQSSEPRLVYSPSLSQAPSPWNMKGKSHSFWVILSVQFVKSSSRGPYLLMNAGTCTRLGAVLVVGEAAER